MPHVTKVDTTTTPPTLHMDDGQTGLVILGVYTPRMTPDEIHARVWDGAAGRVIFVLRNGLVSPGSILEYAISVGDEEYDEGETPIDTIPERAIDLDAFDGIWTTKGYFLGFDNGVEEDSDDFEGTPEDAQDGCDGFDVVYIVDAPMSFKLVPLSAQEAETLARDSQYAADVADAVKTHLANAEDVEVIR